MNRWHHRCQAASQESSDVNNEEVSHAIPALVRNEQGIAGDGDAWACLGKCVGYASHPIDLNAKANVEATF